VALIANAVVVVLVSLATRGRSFATGAGAR